jgi:tetratricopeptide (TPR) repeat protein
MEKNKTFIINLFIINLLFFSFAQNLERPHSLFSFIDTTTAQKIEQSSLYLKANYFQEEGNYLRALKIYNHLFSLDAPNYVYEGYLRLLSQTNQFSTIVKLIDKTENLFKEDIEIQLIYAQSLLNTKRDKQAKEMLNRLKKKYPNNEQVIYYSTALHEKSNNLEKALADIDKFLEKNDRKTKHLFFYFLKAKIYLKMGKTRESLAAINKSIDLYPQFDKGLLFKALLLEQMNDITSAIDSYKQFLSVTGYNLPIIKQLVRLLFSQNRFKEAAIELKKIKKDPITNSYPTAYYFDLALLEWKSKNYNQAIAFGEKAIEKNKNFFKAKILVTQIVLDPENRTFNKNKKEGEILKRATRWIRQTPHDNHTIHMLLMLAQNGLSAHRVIKTLEQAGRQYRNQTNILDCSIPTSLS